ncbi:hypothetical protein QVD99_002035 [Batrachochytrium dendrobatidis]|nr:hypothetical protein QVD99_002035 [Batrachochytrium dendrobatidis]
MVTTPLSEHHTMNLAISESRSSQSKTLSSVTNSETCDSTHHNRLHESVSNLSMHTLNQKQNDVGCFVTDMPEFLPGSVLLKESTTDSNSIHSATNARYSETDPNPKDHSTVLPIHVLADDEKVSERLNDFNPKSACSATRINKSSSKLLHYDGLRGVAAIWVFFLHYLNGPTPALHSFLLAYQPWSASVPIFFILSGRVLTASILRTGNPRQLVSAMIRRPFRLFVPMIIMATLDQLIFHFNGPVNYGKLIADHLWFMFDSASIPNTGTWVLWTLSYEYINSNIIFAVTLVLLQFQDNPKARYLVLCGTIVWFQITTNWGALFITGLLMCDLARHGYFDRYRAWRYSHVINTLLFITSGMLLFRNPLYNIADSISASLRSQMYSHGKKGVSDDYSIQNPQIFFFAASTMLCVETSTYIQWALSRRVFIFLGQISFPLYLLHPHLFKTLDKVNVGIRSVVTNPVLEAMIIFIVCTFIVCSISYLLIHIIDTPSIHIGKWVERVVLVEEWSLHAIKGWFVNIPGQVQSSITQRIKKIRNCISRK